jgi:hypothetical protein
MAIQRSTVTQLITEIRRNIGEPNSARSHVTDANLYLLFNRYLQKLSHRLADAMRAEGIRVKDGGMRLDMWRTTWESTDTAADSALVVTAASPTVYLPTNYDHYISFYDKTHERPLFVIHDPALSTSKVKELKERGPGVPEAIHIKGYVSNASYWVREATLYPDTPSGTTPSLTLEGWRLPTQVTTGSDSPDIDPKYEELLVMGLSTMLLRKDDPNYKRFAEEERALLLNAANTARAS